MFVYFELQQNSCSTRIRNYVKYKAKNITLINEAKTRPSLGNTLLASSTYNDRNNYSFPTAILRNVSNGYSSSLFTNTEYTMNYSQQIVVFEPSFGVPCSAEHVVCHSMCLHPLYDTSLQIQPPPHRFSCSTTD